MSAVSFSTIAQPNPGALVLIEVPEKVVKKLGAGKRVPARVTLNGVDYRSTIAVYGDRYYLPARKEGAIEVQRADEGAGARRGTRGTTAKRPAKAKAEAGQWPREGPRARRIPRTASTSRTTRSPSHTEKSSSTGSARRSAGKRGRRESRKS